MSVEPDTSAPVDKALILSAEHRYWPQRPKVTELKMLTSESLSSVLTPTLPLAVAIKALKVKVQSNS